MSDNRHSIDINTAYQRLNSKRLNSVESINLVLFISIYLCARLGMRMLWLLIFDEDYPGFQKEN